MNCYIMSWHPVYTGAPRPVDRQMLLNVLDKLTEVVSWRASTGTIFLLSEASARTISERLREEIPDLLFVILPIRIEDVWGWTDKETWDFIKNTDVKV